MLPELHPGLEARPDPGRVRAWSRARNVLAVRLDGMGDVLMTEPAMRALRESVPGRRLTLLASRAGAEIAPLLPAVDDVLAYEAPWMKASAPRPDGRADLAFIEELRGRDFDAAVVFTVYSQNPLPAALMCFLAGIPLRLAHCRERAYELLTDRVPEPEPHAFVRHEVRRQLDLVAAVGCTTLDPRMRLEVPRAARERTDALLAEAVVPGRPWAVLHPGASAPSRRYPLRGFVEVARGLEALGWAVLVSGAEDERALAEALCEGGHAVNLAGRFDAGGLAALFARAPVVVTNNTGPAHVAAAVGAPLVDLYAQTNPQHTPWMAECRVLTREVPCAPCYSSVCPLGHHACLAGVPPSEVVRAAVGVAREPASNLVPDDA